MDIYYSIVVTYRVELKLYIFQFASTNKELCIRSGLNDHPK
ncbi:hypothetical protein PP1Y_AT14874 [Novosphingobium sp. PP1Y]|nr:hypothetical protein PP1Y_AT14874 [Novosphingobium sp. PP1Y]